MDFTTILTKKNWHAAAAHIGSFLLVVLLFSYFSKAQKHAKAQLFRYTIPNPKNLVGQGTTGAANTVATNTCNSNNASSSTTSGQCQTDPAFAPPQKTYSFNVIYGCLAFFAITAFAHIFYATDGFNSGSYSAFVAEGWNPYRWAEYAVSASIMTLLIAYQLGIKDASHLTSLVFINVAMQACGFLVENALIQPQVNTTVVRGATIAGWTLFAGMWIPIVYAFYCLVKDVNKNYEGAIVPPGYPDSGKPIKVPNFVWFIIIVQIFNFSSFGLIQLGQVRASLKGNPIPFDIIESRYILLSYIGKLALAGGIAYGLIFRTRSC